MSTSVEKENGKQRCDMGGWFYRHRQLYPPNWDEIAYQVKEEAGWKCELCHAPHGPPPFVLTVDHLDFNPGNCARENMMALCQRDHLRRQAMRPPPMTKEEVFRRMTPRGVQLDLWALPPPSPMSQCNNTAG